MCIAERISGVFMQPLHFLRNGERANRAVLSALEEAHIPVVLLDSDFVQPPRRSSYDLVGTDNLRIGYDLARYMIESGAKRIVYISEPRPAPTSMLRGMGVGFAVSEAGLKWRTDDIMFVRGSEMRTVVKRMFTGKNRPDGIIACHDYLGVEVLEELLKAGLKVPDDVLLAGVDGDHVSAQCDPPLTTFVQPCEEIGSAAVELMLSRVENPSLPPREMMIASQFVARASTAPFAKKGR
jgi:LacI family transcriptional regulator